MFLHTGVDGSEAANVVYYSWQAFMVEALTEAGIFTANVESVVAFSVVRTTLSAVKFSLATFCLSCADAC
jgi:hypothetical protein